MAKKFKFLWVELTNRCNFECPHCYANSSPINPLFGDLTIEDYKSLITKFSKYGGESIQFIGGEPLLNPHIDTYIKLAHDCNYQQIEVYTNLSLFHNKHIDLFKKHKVSVATSYYSNEELVHKIMTNSKSPLSKIENNISKCLRNDISIRVNVILDNNNYENQSDIIHRLKRLGVSKIGVDKVRSIGRANKSNIINYNNELCGSCGYEKLAISPSGNIYPCVMSKSHNLGNWKDIQFGKTLQNKALEFRRLVFGNETRNHELNRAECVPSDGCLPVNPCSPISDPKPSCNPAGGCGPHGPCNPRPWVSIEPNSF